MNARLARNMIAEAAMRLGMVGMRLNLRIHFNGIFAPGDSAKAGAKLGLQPWAVSIVFARPGRSAISHTGG